MIDLGFNYRLTDFQCALGISQLEKLSTWIKRRQAIAHAYDESFARQDAIRPLSVSPDVAHAYHLYVVQIHAKKTGKDRAHVYRTLRSKGIGVNVHYIPVHLHPYYRKTFKTTEGQCPVAESAYQRILSLPIYPELSDPDLLKVVTSICEATK